MKVPHCDNNVSFTSEGRWLITIAPTPNFRPSLMILWTIANPGPE